jgi:hypothetical protein
MACVLVAGVVFLAACEDDGVSPGDELTPDDAQFVADQMAAEVAGLLNDLFDSGAFGPSGAPALSHGPVVTSYTFSRSRPCHDGGTLTLEGGGTRTWDHEAVTYDVESSGTKTRTDCAHTRNGGVITLNGGGDWTHERHYVDHAPTGSWITTYVGDFDWTKSTDKSGNCTFDLVRTIDTAENTRSLTGTVCGREIDRSGTWREADA